MGCLASASFDHVELIAVLYAREDSGLKRKHALSWSSLAICLNVRATFFYETFSVVADVLRRMRLVRWTSGQSRPYGGTSDWVSEAQVRRSHAIIRKYSVSPMSLR